MYIVPEQKVSNISTSLNSRCHKVYEISFRVKILKFIFIISL